MQCSGRGCKFGCECCITLKLRRLEIMVRNLSKSKLAVWCRVYGSMNACITQKMPPGK